MSQHPRTKHRLLGCMLALVWAVLTLALIFRLNSCLSGHHPVSDLMRVEEILDASEPFYDPNDFRQVDGRCVFEGAQGTACATGVDVSAHQGDIDWQAVAADGISFAMIRVGWRGNTDGYLHEDACFEQNWAGAQEAGLPCGVYFYSQATSEAEAHEEAAFALDLLAGRELAYPVVFDFEPTSGQRIARVDTDTATACARTFCNVVAEGGYEPMVYGNRYDLRYLDAAQLTDVRVWFAQYAPAPSRDTPFALWQYTSTGSVAGIATPVDLNLDLSAV